jgi:YggT family protein
MFLARDVISTLAVVIHWVLEAYFWVVVVRAVISWVSPDPWNPIVQTLARLTDPLLDPIRRKLFRFAGYGGMGIDLSPVILLIGIRALDYFLVSVLTDIAVRLQ